MSTPGALQPSEFKQIATEVSDWLWGTVQGAWNEKQTVSQIITDAVIGMIPLVGQATAARDLLAVGSGMAQDQAKRESIWEWVLLCILLLSLIPVLGGVLKGVGRLTLRAAKEAAQDSAKLAALADDMVAFLNRVGHKDGATWLKNLDFTKYEPQLIERCRAFCDTVILGINRYIIKFGAVLPEPFVLKMKATVKGFEAIKAASGKMIPRALKELNEHLKKIQAKIIAGGVPPVERATLFQAQTGKTVKTYADEARLIESGAKKAIIKAGKYPQNLADEARVGDVYKYEPGYPDLKDERGKKTVTVKGKSVEYYSPIAAASGPIKNVNLGDEGATLFRAFGPEGTTHGKKVDASKPSGMWWGMGEPPKTAKEWREKSAVLDEWNRNGMVAIMRIPKGAKVPACTSTVSEQFSKEIPGQFLEGGGKQAAVDFSLAKDLDQANDVMDDLLTLGGGKRTLPSGIVIEVRHSGWGGINGKVGYGDEVIPGAGIVERLGVTEMQGKVGLTGAQQGAQQAAANSGTAVSKDHRAAPNREKK